MYRHLPGSDKPQSPNRTRKFEGRHYGVELSFFEVEMDPGQGPGQHRHPYAEVWLVLSGRAEFFVGRDRSSALPGDVVIVPPGIAHRFANVGPKPLSMICIHSNGVIEQTDLKEEQSFKPCSPD